MYISELHNVYSRFLLFTLNTVHHNTYKPLIPAVTTLTIPLRLSQYTRHELATLVLVLAVVSMLLFLAVNVLVLKLIFLHRGYRSNLGLAPSYNRYPRHHSSSNGILTSSNYDSQNTTSTSRQDEAKNSLSCSKDTKNCSPSTSIIIDLSQDTAKCGKDVSSVLSGGVGASPPAFKAKKRFGPKRGTIKHLISKSFSGNKGAGGGGGGASCPGRGSDDDGVVLNIEDCCQMTLCETVSCQNTKIRTLD